MTFYNIVNEESRIQCELKDGIYLYSIRENDSTIPIGKRKTSPLEITPKSEIGKEIFKRIDKASPTGDKSVEFHKILAKMDEDIQQQIEDAMNDEGAEEKDLQKVMEEKYAKLHSDFTYNCEKYNLTPLQYCIYVFDALGVNASLEIMKAFCGYLQTYLGLKGTNVIGVGNQSSGKTHCVENPLECIPDEFVHKGIYSKASFYTEFAGRDLTHHIFYLGDLGGDNDDENTKEFRDELKKLSTDGSINRHYKVDGEVLTETITGYPALAYTTVSEKMINDQEKSRSTILMPPDVDQRRLTLYNNFLESPGSFFELKLNIQRDKESIKGFVWWLKQEISNVEMFNPFMFCVQRYLTNMADFNRKINEFNMLLKIICILNDSFKIEHELYYDVETEESIVTELYLPSKQDVIDALNLFEGSTGLLPREIALARGLLKKFDEVPAMFTEPVDELGDNASFEEVVVFNATKGENPVLDVQDDELGKPFIEDYDVGILGDDGEQCNCFFSIDNVRRGSANQRWYREVKADLSDKLRKLYSFGILIHIGKTSEGRNIYAFGENVRKQIESIEPVFGKKDIELAKQTFHLQYPSLIENYDEFIKAESLKSQLKNTNFEIKQNPLYDLFWNTLEVE